MWPSCEHHSHVAQTLLPLKSRWYVQGLSVKEESGEFGTRSEEESPVAKRTPRDAKMRLEGPAAAGVTRSAHQPPRSPSSVAETASREER